MNQADDRWLAETLHALPSPAMPDDVRRRLDAAIAGAAVPSLPAPRSGQLDERAGGHRRTWLLAGASAAAAITVFGVLDPLDGPDNRVVEAEVATVLRETGTRYSEAGLTAQVRRIMAAQTTSARTSELSGRPEASTLELAAVATCLAAVPGLDGKPLLVDHAWYAGVRAIVAVFDTEDGWDVVVQRVDCTAAEPAVVARATVERR